MKKITHVEVLENYRLYLTFADSKRGTVDLSDLAGSGVFAFWKNYEDFRKVKIGDTGELVWADQVDLCPDSLYLKITGKKPEDLFPSLKRETGACLRSPDHHPLRLRGKSLTQGTRSRN